MSLSSNILDHLRHNLSNAGYASTNKPFDVDSLSKSDTVMDCRTIAGKNHFNIIYLQVKSNWKSTVQEVAIKDGRPCLVITAYNNYVILATIKEYGTNNAHSQYVVLDKPEKQLREFVKAIKVSPDAKVSEINSTIQKAFDTFSEYSQALKAFDEILATIIADTKKAVDRAIRGNKRYQDFVEQFLESCRVAINDQISETDVRDMLIQHILTYRIFAMVYDDYDFHSTNIIAKSLESLRHLLAFEHTKINYGSMEIIAESLTTGEEKQEFLKKVYETFYKRYDPKKADREGIVYTPLEVVNFMIDSIDVLLKRNFDSCLSDHDVSILDPATGTGTFPAQILRRLDPDKIETKYQNDIFANELYVLPYYIAALNIEYTYREITGKHSEFKNICWMDTLETGSKDFGKLTLYSKGDHNVKRISRQQSSRINVIVGNPPYSIGQHDANENNPNMSYPVLDKKIEDTFVKKTKELDPTIGRVSSLYDSYLRFFKWAYDRIDESGIVAYVTNAGFIRSDAGAGVRAVFTKEFDEIWCFDLRGNQRTKGDISRREGGKIFGSGSRTPISITFLVRNPKKQVKNQDDKNGVSRNGTIYYRDIGDYLDREEKLDLIVDAKSINGIQWDKIQPDKHHDWLNKRSDDFLNYIPLGDKDFKSQDGGMDAFVDPHVIFKMFSLGVATSRDVWTYNPSKQDLAKNMKKHIIYCNKMDKKAVPTNGKRGTKWKSFLQKNHDPTQGKWGYDLFDRIKRRRPKFDPSNIRIATHRPFFKQYLYYDYHFNARQYKIPLFFPKGSSENIVICVPNKFTEEFSTFATNTTPDIQLNFNGQCFPLYIYDKNKKKNDNITDSILMTFREYYKTNKITKIQIFEYVYGLLHHPRYRSKYANNINKDFPRIPMAPDFVKFREIGSQLMKLHLNFETCEKYDLGVPKYNFDEFSKLQFPKKRIKVTTGNGKIKEIDTFDESKVKIDGKILFENIPEVNYTVNGRTPLGWVVDQYKITTDDGKAGSGITKDPCTGTDIIAIIERAVHIGVKSDRLILQLPEKFEPEKNDQKNRPQ